MINLGIDIGSRNTKVVLYNVVNGEIIYHSYGTTDVEVRTSIDRLVEEAFRESSITWNNINRIGTTGYGRKLFPKVDSVLSEITCHARGCQYYFPEARCIIDIGGQDSKIIAINEQSKVDDFVMNDKCAAGTGRFLEMTAFRLACEVGGLADIAAEAELSLKLNSTCVVFAESEIISMMASAVSPQEIARAVHNSISRRISSQMSSLAWETPIVFTGGVAMNKDLARCISRELGFEVLIPPEPEITGALGAAILAGNK